MMESYLVTDYKKADCPEVNDQIGLALHGLTKGKICDSGCNRFNGGNCKSYRILISAKTATAESKPGETVRSEAERRGISIKKVRRERSEAANQ